MAGIFVDNEGKANEKVPMDRLKDWLGDLFFSMEKGKSGIQLYMGLYL